ncbi:hypothetical protein NAS141_19779 [Sulfitobacter sp. NAS-14.1]|nr:hypothetical protein NAS141_19779 [Sulfitobacter sp. NAS-14.1]
MSPLLTVAIVIVSAEAAAAVKSEMAVAVRKAFKTNIFYLPDEMLATSLGLLVNSRQFEFYARLVLRFRRVFSIL